MLWEHEPYSTAFSRIKVKIGSYFGLDREHKPWEIQTLQSSTSNVSKSPLVSSFITCSSSFLYSETNKIQH